MVFSFTATLINLATAKALLYYGCKFHSITMEADSKHLMTDVWSTVGIFLGIFIIKPTDWYIIDPLIAIVVILSISYTGMMLPGTWSVYKGHELTKKLNKEIADTFVFSDIYSFRASQRSGILR